MKVLSIFRENLEENKKIFCGNYKEILWKSWGIFVKILRKSEEIPQKFGENLKEISVEILKNYCKNFEK